MDIDQTLKEAIDTVRWTVRGGSIFVNENLPNVCAWYVLQASDTDWLKLGREYHSQRDKITDEATQWLGGDDVVEFAHQIFGRGGTIEEYRQMARSVITGDDSDMSE